MAESKTYGWRAWSDAGFRDQLVCVVPPDGRLAAKTTLTDEMRGKAPGRFRNGVWTGQKDWYTYEPTEADIGRWSDLKANTGMKAGLFPALDVDIMDVALVRRVLTIARDTLGLGAVRVGRRPKALVMYRLADDAALFGPVRLKFTLNGSKHIVEFLGEGAQYLVGGIHPTTRRPYEWLGPLSPMQPEALPAINLDGVKAFFAAVVTMLEGLGAEITSRGSAVQRPAHVDAVALRPPVADDDAAVEAVRELVHAIGNTDEDFPTRESYVNMLIAIKGALYFDEGAALDVAHEWSDLWDGGHNPPTETERIVKGSSTYKLGWPYLFDLACSKSAAWDFDERFGAPPAPADASDSFYADVEAALLLGDGTRVASLTEQAATAGVDVGLLLSRAVADLVATRKMKLHDTLRPLREALDAFCGVGGMLSGIRTDIDDILKHPVGKAVCVPLIACGGKIAGPMIAAITKQKAAAINAAMKLVERDARDLRTVQREAETKVIANRFLYVASINRVYDWVTAQFYTLQSAQILAKEFTDIDITEFFSRDASSADATYSYLDYRPGLPHRCTVSGKLVDGVSEGSARVLNSWRPGPLKPVHGATHADVAPWLALLGNMLPDKREQTLFLDWACHIVQRPGVKINWCLVLQSVTEGVGKGTLLRPIQDILGDSNWAAITMTQLQKPEFSPYLQSQLLIMEEVKITRETNNAFLKPIITNPPATLRINDKNIPAYHIQNRLATCIMTNEANAVVLSDTDRRYLILSCDIPEHRRWAGDGAEWTALYDLYASPLGISKIYGWLLARQITPGFSAHGTAPMTAAKAEMRDFSLDEVDQLMADAIETRRGPFKRRLVSSRALEDWARSHVSASAPALRMRGFGGRKLKEHHGLALGKFRFSDSNGNPRRDNLYAVGVSARVHDMTPDRRAALVQRHLRRFPLESGAGADFPDDLDD